MMKNDELKPYLTSFITVVLTDGSEHSGYISNPKELEKGSDTVRLLNGVYSEDIKIEEIQEVTTPDREDTVSIPVIDLKQGYETKTKEDTGDLKLNEMLDEIFHKKKKD